MSIWDNIKKFTQPYSDDEEYDDDFEESEDGDIFGEEPKQESGDANFIF